MTSYTGYMRIVAIAVQIIRYAIYTMIRGRRNLFIAMKAQNRA